MPNSHTTIIDATLTGVSFEHNGTNRLTIDIPDTTPVSGNMILILQGVSQPTRDLARTIANADETTTVRAAYQSLTTHAVFPTGRGMITIREDDIPMIAKDLLARLLKANNT